MGKPDINRNRQKPGRTALSHAASHERRAKPRSWSVSAPSARATFDTVVNSRRPSARGRDRSAPRRHPQTRLRGGRDVVGGFVVVFGVPRNRRGSGHGVLLASCESQRRSDVLGPRRRDRLLREPHFAIAFAFQRSQARVSVPGGLLSRNADSSCETKVIGPPRMVAWMSALASTSV
jgi:hypothetical protein